MRKLLFVLLLAVATTATAQPRGPGWGYGGGCWNCGGWGYGAGWAAAGLITGALIANALQPAPVYAYPQPVYVAPPQPPQQCGYVPYYNAYGQYIGQRMVCQPLY